jgi:hypothetical protein
MKAHTVLVLLFASTLAIGCSNGRVPDPKDPSTGEPTLEGEPEHEGKPLTSGLIITASPNVEVLVDGKSIGTTPVTAEPLEPGAHDVTFMFEGDERVTQTIELAEGEYQKVHQSVSPDSSDARVGK